MPLFLNVPKVLFSASDEAKLLAGNAFRFRATLKLHNIFVTLKLIKKGITDLVLSKTPGPDCISIGGSE